MVILGWDIYQNTCVRPILYPHTSLPYKTQTKLNARAVSISAAIIVPSIIIALNMTSVEKYWRFFGTWASDGIKGIPRRLPGGGGQEARPVVRERVMDEEQVIESGRGSGSGSIDSFPKGEGK